jgi:hypothetical protein
MVPARGSSDQTVPIKWQIGAICCICRRLSREHSTAEQGFTPKGLVVGPTPARASDKTNGLPQYRAISTSCWK